MNPIQNRYDFLYLFDAKDCNPNGDPDADNLPRIDMQTEEGLTTDVFVKRRVRNYVYDTNPLAKRDINQYDIFIRERPFEGEVVTEYLNYYISNAKGNTPKERKQSLINNYYDIRTFGAVLSTGGKEDVDDDINNKLIEDGDKSSSKKKGGSKKKESAGTVRGPVQFTFARSFDKISQDEHGIIRVAVTTEKEAQSQKKNDREYPSTIGRKSTVPYGLYRMYGFVSVSDAIKTNFSEDDLSLLFEALRNWFDGGSGHSASKGLMHSPNCFIFRHNNALGHESSKKLFDLVEKKISLKQDKKFPRDVSDYLIPSLDEVREELQRLYNDRISLDDRSW
ncbi:MAG: type I CRISPR-associated protein Cas7 [Leptospiraceae bacterium]|nr:type I CRISPR-associated protein Cas7 [Leptospiraceae bacterium]MCP5496093.1 type I CRISPR-associated protein Cas7 [Leptospiraceae bacterium]